MMESERTEKEILSYNFKKCREILINGCSISQGIGCYSDVFISYLPINIILAMQLLKRENSESC